MRSGNYFRKLIKQRIFLPISPKFFQPPAAAREKKSKGQKDKGLRSPRRGANNPKTDAVAPDVRTVVVTRRRTAEPEIDER